MRKSSIIPICMPKCINGKFQGSEVMFDARQLLDQFIGAAEGVAGMDNIDKVRKGITENP